MPRGVYAAWERRDVPLRVRKRFIAYIRPVVDSAVEDDCWEWPLSTASHGYGQIGWGSKKAGRGLILTHRLSYLVFRGSIPSGMTVDHRCRNRLCCNPEHLRLLTNLENAQDNGPARRTHCPQGHPYDDENTIYRLTGKRRLHRACRTCQLAHKRAYYKFKQGQVA